MYDYDRTSASRLRMGPGRGDPKNTETLRKVKLKARNDGSFNGAVLSAGFYAQKLKKTMYVYEGNSFMHRVFRVTDKMPELLSPVNNTGNRVVSVTPELEVSWHDIDRAGQPTSEDD